MKDCEPVNVIQETWDYLIILDACRYDYFEKVWQNYFPEGQLTCRYSVGSSTDEWRDKSFPGYYEDIVYISANPQISSSSPVFGYLASEHFKYIHEVWKTDWDEQAGTVLPQIVTQRAREIIPNYRRKKFVIHYLQPHAPYIDNSFKTAGFNRGDFNEDRSLIKTDKRCRFLILKRLIFKCLHPLFKNNDLLSNRPDWVLRKLLRIHPKAPMESAWRQLGVNGLRKAYINNLDSVLISVSELIKEIEGKIIITSDHGEFLGEQKKFAHPTGVRHPILNEVPWLVIQRHRDTALKTSLGIVKEKDIHNDKNHLSTKQEMSDEMILQRLRDLGYCE